MRNVLYVLQQKLNVDDKLWSFIRKFLVQERDRRTQEGAHQVNDVMEKLKSHIETKIFKEAMGEKISSKNQSFNREIHYKVVSESDPVPDQMAFGDKSERDISNLEVFVRSQISDKAFQPPIKIVVVGDDRDFNAFVQEYVKLFELDSAEKSNSYNSMNKSLGQSI